MINFKINLVKVPEKSWKTNTEFRKVWFGGARETHWVTRHHEMTPMKTKESQISLLFKILMVSLKCNLFLAQFDSKKPYLENELHRFIAFEKLNIRSHRFLLFFIVSLIEMCFSRNSRIDIWVSSISHRSASFCFWDCESSKTKF